MKFWFGKWLGCASYTRNFEGAVKAEYIILVTLIALIAITGVSKVASPMNIGFCATIKQGFRDVTVYIGANGHCYKPGAFGPGTFYF